MELLVNFTEFPASPKTLGDPRHGVKEQKKLAFINTDVYMYPGSLQHKNKRGKNIINFKVSFPIRQPTY